MYESVSKMKKKITKEEGKREKEGRMGSRSGKGVGNKKEEREGRRGERDEGRKKEGAGGRRALRGSALVCHGQVPRSDAKLLKQKP